MEVVKKTKKIVRNRVYASLTS